LPALVVSSISPSPVDDNVAAREHLVEAQQNEHRGRARHEFHPERRTRPAAAPEPGPSA
jgi:hypothetical protein